MTNDISDDIATELTSTPSASATKTNNHSVQPNSTPVPQTPPILQLKDALDRRSADLDYHFTILGSYTEILKDKLQKVENEHREQEAKLQTYVAEVETQLNNTTEKWETADDNLVALKEELEAMSNKLKKMEDAIKETKDRLKVAEGEVVALKKELVKAREGMTWGLALRGLNAMGGIAMRRIAGYTLLLRRNLGLGTPGFMGSIAKYTRRQVGDNAKT